MSKLRQMKRNQKIYSQKELDDILRSEIKKVRKKLSDDMNDKHLRDGVKVGSYAIDQKWREAMSRVFDRKGIGKVTVDIIMDEVDKLPEEVSIEEKHFKECGLI